MNAFENNVKTLVSSDDAIQNYIGEQFLEWLLETITSEVRSWPELKQIRESSARPEKIKKFILQRYLAAESFLGGKDGEPGFLGFAIANLSESPDPLAENALGILEQKREEEFAGSKGAAAPKQNTHQDLWIKLLKALDLSSEDIARAEAKEATRTYISELSDIYSTSEWQTVMGAFLAHERAIPDEYAAISQMIKKNTSVGPEAMEVFTWHAGVDIKYVINTSHMLEKIVVDPESKQLVWEGVVKQLSIRKDFYASLARYLEG
ncbi:MAG TPA: iron-containing redox enzyme family protein [Verrucomicrobiae bacterium]|nr:iron-containing redox enzyme family protein [Verrucomicrobiae bacterium]